MKIISSSFILNTPLINPKENIMNQVTVTTNTNISMSSEHRAALEGYLASLNNATMVDRGVNATDKALLDEIKAALGIL